MTGTRERGNGGTAVAGTRTAARLTTIGLIAGILSAVPAFPRSAAAQETPPPGGTPKGFELAEQREFTLPNGMAVTLVPYGDVPKVLVQVVVRAGNADEQADQVWLSDLTGDLMQEGTTSRSAEELAREVAGMGGQLFVAVGMDETTIGADVLAEDAPGMVALVADVVRHPAFPASELDRLKADRLRDLAIQRTQPQPLALEKFRSVMYPDHPYGRIYPTEAMIQGYTVEQMRAFHQANYGAGRAHLYVVGRFDPAAVEQAAREAFGDWERGTPPARTEAEPVSRREIHLIDRPGAPQSTIVMGLPVVDPSHPDYTAMQVTNTLLGGSFASRITSNIREQKGYTYSPFSTVSTRYRDAYWAEQADVTTAVTGASLKEIFAEIDRLRNEPPPADELRGIQTYLAGTYVLQNSSRGGIANQLAFLDLHGLPDSYLTEYVERVYAVTPDRVQRIAQTYLDPAEMLIVVVGDRAQVEPQLEPYRTATP